MFSTGDVIDGKYRVTGLCSDRGGMGTILDVVPLAGTPANRIVLKYCKDMSPIVKERFCREVRYLLNFSGNSLVVEVLDSNLNMDPPYFVMKYYADGDLCHLASRIKSDTAFQEITFNKMLDCIAELHASAVQHRDIKPQNFLVDGDHIVVSDFGLAKEIGAGTTFTRSSEWWGTEGYLPPEFLAGGFKVATAQSDIFMLGKTFYVLLSGRDPLYLTDLNVPPAVFHVIQRCCNMNSNNRYATISELRQDLKLAYDVMLGRANGIGTARQRLSKILDRLNSEQKYDSDQVVEFLDLLAKLPVDERASLLSELPPIFYHVLAQSPVESRLETFLEQYVAFSLSSVATWPYAETVANNMKIIFNKSDTVGIKTKALEIAIDAAIAANRFAAMDTCIAMITSITDEQLGVAVAAVISRHKGSFVDRIETSRCFNDAIRHVIRSASQ